MLLATFSHGASRNRGGSARWFPAISPIYEGDFYRKEGRKEGLRRERKSSKRFALTF
jgi:hypothetical protein